MSTLPLLLEPAELHARLQHAPLLLVDLRNPENYAQGHIPGAVNLPYSAIIRTAPPVGGLLPSSVELSQRLSAIGLTPTHHVVAYDSEGGGRSGRLLWTLQALGHPHCSVLNGGLAAWMDEQRPLETTSAGPQPSDYHAQWHCPEVIAERDYIQSRLGAADFLPLDCRSPAEYAGQDIRAARGGHIPGAVNLNWLECIDENRALRFKPEADLRRTLETLGVTPDKDIVVYCQTHHRSSHTYTVLKYLGYPRVRGYPGSWSDWGNASDTPIAT